VHGAVVRYPAAVAPRVSEPPTVSPVRRGVVAHPCAERPLSAAHPPHAGGLPFIRRGENMFCNNLSLTP
jgi:hypothetical protein